MDVFTPTEWMNSPQQDQLMEIYFKDSPIVVDWDFHHSQKVEDGKLVLGPWAGPSQCITNVIHEMGHLVEIDDARILAHGWGLHVPMTECLGREYPNPVTPKACMREVRVFAMQWQLQNFLGIKTEIRELVRLNRFLPDFCFVPKEGEQEGESYDEPRLRYLERRLLEYVKGKYTLEFFNREWSRKNELLRRSLELVSDSQPYHD